MCYSSCCSMWCCVLWGVGWWLLTSLILMFTWNKAVPAFVDNVKQIKFWHALLVVLTMAILFGPMSGNWCGGKSSGDCSRYECGENHDKGCCADSLYKH